MEEINLNEYFEGIPANRTCPSESCPHISETDIEFRDHLWTHKEAEAGRPISNKERSNKCPHPECQNATFNSSILRHMITHTGERSHICPHLISWEPNHERELCGYSAALKYNLVGHRALHHGYKNEPETATDPWVKPDDVALSDAELHFGEVVEEPGADNVNAPQAHANPPQPNVAAPHVPNVNPQAHNANIPPYHAPPPNGHFVPGAHANGVPLNAGANQGPFPGAAHVHGHPHMAHAGPLHLRQVEVTRIGHLLHPLGHIVTEIEKRIYM